MGLFSWLFGKRQTTSRTSDSSYESPSPQRFKLLCDEVEPSTDDFSKGLVDERGRLHLPHSFSRAGTYDSLWQIVRTKLDKAGRVFIGSFDVIYLPNGDSIGINTCTCVRYFYRRPQEGDKWYPSRQIDVVKSSGGDFWYAIEDGN